ncbi:MAG: gliding motility-associated C-terminal domain-containing protein [Bacteroidales bacterium]|nr:gliding motility-associated C-terminal domain-containing protein [Bacteroidales bacterium]
MNKVKKTALTAIALLLATTVMGQQDFCKGLKNPTSFTIASAGNSANAQWYGFTGSKNATASQCGAWGMTGWGTQIAASQLASQSSGSSCTNSGSVDINNQSDYMNRFVIKGPGNDPSTGNRLSYLPPDPGYTSSIRLGNNCGGTHEAEMLCYQFNVRPQNSLIFIWYALSLQNGQHSIPENPEFAIEIEKKVGNNWVRVGGDTLCYIRPTPASPGTDVAPFYRGATGTQTGGQYGENLYLPWNKVAINLNAYLYETVRIKVGAGDCSMSAHYACAYIAGECQSMEIKTSGCPAGSSNVVDTLRAPKGLSNYQWFKCNSGTDGISSLLDVPASINFTAVSAGGPDDSIYLCRTSDFRLTEGPHAGDTANTQIFRCDMTSYMNPSIPLVSKVYVSVRNTKPTMSLDTIKSCDADLSLINKSYVPGDMNGCDTSISKWWFYSGSTNQTTLIDSSFGATAHHRYDSAGIYAVKVRSFNNEDHTCYTDSTYTIRVLGRPTPVMEIDPAREVCVNNTVALIDATPGSVRRDWVLNGDTVFGNRRNNNARLSRIFENYKNPIELIAYNGLYCRDSINTYDTIWCTASAFDTVEVFQHPVLHVSGDTVVCNGERTDITVEAETEGCRYRWYLDTLGSAMISEGQTLSTLPYADTCLYYVKVISPQACEAWDSVNAYRVNPTLSISRHDMCEGDNVTLTSGAAYTYTWLASPADSTLDILLDSLGHGPAEITVSPSQTTTYTLIGHGTNDCSAAPLTEQITIHPIPVATMEAYPAFVDSDNPVVTLTDVSPYSVRRVWTFEEGVGEEYTSPCSHNFGEVSADSVNITLVAYNDLECSDTLNFRLPVTQFTFYAPNAFTPERPDNNTFHVFTANEQENFSVFIYDRMGRLVYTSNDLHFKWDGNSLDGIKCPQGAYAYVIYYRRPNTEDIVTQKGTITLIR